MRNFVGAGILAAGLILVWTLGNATVVAGSDDDNDNKIAVLDDCLPSDPGWAPTGGCALKPHQGNVSFAEFNALLRSPLTIPSDGALIGHPAWRNQPSHLTARSGKTVRVTNKGGRGHTFTEVTNFGGGFVPPLNIGLTQAPQCTPAGTIPLAPGATVELKGLAPGLHRYQCCIHPWMRATIRVE
jgi:plastocyanin